MATVAARPLAERLLHLFQQFGIAQAHIAGRNPADWQDFVSAYPERVASLSLVCPGRLDPRDITALAARTLVIRGDRGPAAGRVQNALREIKSATSITLAGYEPLMWSDLLADRTAEIGAAMLDFLTRIDRANPVPAAPLAEGEGEVAGISYHIRGAGPPLVLLPLELAPTQWAKLLPPLAAHYCTIVLSGAALGIVASLEGRGRSSYINMVRAVLDMAQLQPGEVVLDVGCGSGVVVREVARRTAGANRLIGVDMSPYLLSEARQLARQCGYEDRIEFQEGRAEALPLPDDSIDVTLSCTVMEEGDADRMLVELIRVTKPGGRIAVIVRAIDMPSWVNLPLSLSLKAKVEVPGRIGAAGASAGGCADASLYRRFSAAGLTQLKFFPQLAAVTPEAEEPRLRGLQQGAVAVLTTDERSEWWHSLAQAEAEGTSFIAIPHHCAVGTKR
jgi:SAM-dependent methyltransferase